MAIQPACQFGCPSEACDLEFVSPACYHKKFLEKYFNKFFNRFRECVADAQDQPRFDLKAVFRAEARVRLDVLEQAALDKKNLYVIEKHLPEEAVDRFPDLALGSSAAEGGQPPRFIDLTEHMIPLITAPALTQARRVFTDLQLPLPPSLNAEIEQHNGLVRKFVHQALNTARKKTPKNTALLDKVVAARVSWCYAFTRSASPVIRPQEQSIRTVFINPNVESAAPACQSEPDQPAAAAPASKATKKKKKKKKNKAPAPAPAAASAPQPAAASAPQPEASASGSGSAKKQTDIYAMD